MPTLLQTPWTKIRLFGFRFFALFFILFIFPFPLGYIPGVDRLFGWYESATEWLVKWSGKYLVHLAYDITVMPNGSGDTTFNYVQLLLVFLLSLIVALLWTLADRKARNYDRLCYWVAVYVRYYLATTMLTYGFSKVIKTQFPLPNINRLSQPLGDFSPMGLAWTFMGYSKAYNVFTGLGEVIGGLLLFWRRTVLAGALLLLVVMSNVVALNFCYDIPVKIYSSLLLLMALWISWPYRQRMYQFFIKNSDVLPHPFYQVVLRRWQTITLRVIKFVLIAWSLLANISDNYEYYSMYGDEAPKQEFEGVYDVGYFILNKDTVLPLTTDTTRWRKLLVSNNGSATVKLMNDSLQRFSVQKDTAKKEWFFKNRVDTNDQFTLQYQKVDSNHLVLTGIYKKDSLYVTMTKLPHDNYLLLKRGFHWINEYPFNR